MMSQALRSLLLAALVWVPTVASFRLDPFALEPSVVARRPGPAEVAGSIRSSGLPPLLDERPGLPEDEFPEEESLSEVEHPAGGTPRCAAGAPPARAIPSPEPLAPLGTRPGVACRPRGPPTRGA